MKCKILYLDNCQMAKVGFIQMMSDYAHVEFIENNNQDLFEVFVTCTPDILMINIDTINGELVDDIMKVILKRSYLTRVVLISNSISKKIFKEFCSKKVLGFLYLNSKKNEITNCFQKVLDRKIFVSKEFLDNFHDNVDEDILIRSSFETLTYKEVQVVKYIIIGKTSKEIGELFSNSKRTIETHRQNIAEKLDMLGQGRLTLFLIKRKRLIIELLEKKESNHNQLRQT